MQREPARFSFPNAEAYAFLFENAPLLLLSWARDDVRLLFLIKEQRQNELVLDHPGERFCDRVLSAIHSIFHIQLVEDGASPKRYTLGSYFAVGPRLYGAYYERDVEQPDVILFRIEGEPPDCRLEPPDPAEYDEAAAAFIEQHRDWMEIHEANRSRTALYLAGAADTGD